MSHPSHHYSLHLLSRKRTIKAVDSSIYVVGAFGNMAVIPQIIKAWSGDSPGLAVSTWVLFIIVSLAWLMYAILHRQKPLIVAQAVGVTVNLAVVAGWAFNTYLI